MYAPRPDRKEATNMAPGSGTSSFAVTHPVADRYSVVAPWGRVVATFSTAEDGALVSVPGLGAGRATIDVRVGVN